MPSIKVKHEYGYIRAGEYQLFTQCFKPSNQSAMVILLHGYLDHAGSFNRLITFLIENHFEVVCYDLPGHGLSSGERATISSFEDYITSLQVIYDRVVPSLTQRPYFIAHSTGAMIGLEFAKRSVERFAKMALVAPLFRPPLWQLSKIGLLFTRKIMFINSFKRIFQTNSSDQDYLLFTKRDPLQEKRLPLSWLEALNKWLRFNDHHTSEDLSFLMIQGDHDKTIDSKYGLKKVQESYPNSQVIIMGNGHHQLLNEGDVIRNQTFSILLKFLKG
ncbi:alpha/beta fold hydrolase [Halalkalibacter krulwichiae]|uniref:Phospholipase YtpA n=1 Tax=Halalkalibacter krulwichiae TaxID=199441 RepID=A0A1X9MA12_9BACI|nr:alpha/beta hydrolase [Halalkalibacter krulwichiae]ARK29003.1 Phospholipase YtpA [Halalkalibacter krulwichiae]